MRLTFQVGKNKLPCKVIYKTIHTILGTSLNNTHAMTPYLSEERGEVKKGRSGQAASSYSGFSRFGYNTLTHAHKHSVVHFASYKYLCTHEESSADLPRS